MRCKLAGDVDRRGAVRTADYPDRGGLANREVHDAELGQPERPEQSREDTELRRSAEEQRPGIRQQRPEIGQRADPHEDDQRKCAGLDADDIGHVQQSVARGNLNARYVAQEAAETDRHEQERFELLDDAEV